VAVFKKLLLMFGAFSVAFIVISNLVIIISTKKYIFVDLNQISSSETGIILGASVYKDKVSVIVKDRIDTAVNLYNHKKVSKILISGDKTERFYNEVKTIKLWLNKANIPDKDILLDYSGFSTYESMFRAAKRLKIKNAIIISQKYHLPRAVYIARSFGINSQGLSADRVTYKKIVWYEFREIFARLKDFVLCIC
jgi:vancomycin permeability regulator SanA